MPRLAALIGVIPVVLFAGTGLLRIWRCLSTHLSGDATVVGLNGFQIIDGSFPIFFMGQKFMAALDSYLSAPLFLLFGPSTLTANVVSTLVMWGTIGILYLSLKRVFGDRGRLVGLYTLAFPTAFSLFSQTDGKSFYHLSFFFDALLIWITLEIKQKLPDPGKLLIWVWGLTAGLAFWNNFLSLVVIAPCIFYLGLTLPARFWLPGAGLSLAGAAAGAWPLVAFSVFQEWPWLGVVAPGESYTLTDRLSLLFFNSLPVVLGIHPEDVYGLAPLSFPFAVYLLLLVLLLWSLIGMGVKGLKTSSPFWLIPVLILALNLAAALVGGRPGDYRGHNQRYLLPLYLALPFVWGYLAERIVPTRKTFWCFILLWGLVQGTGYMTFKVFQDPAPLLNLGRGDYFTKEQALKSQIQGFRQNGFHFIYQANDFSLAFLSGGDPVFAYTLDYLDQKASAWVGAALNPAYRMPLEANFRLLGLPYLETNGFFHTFSEPLGAGRLLPVVNGSATTLKGVPLHQSLLDGDIHTGFNTRGTTPHGQGFVVDLGEEKTLGGLVLIPRNYMEMPGGLKLEMAGEHSPFKIVREVLDYRGPFYQSGPHPFYMVRNPRIECYFQPQAARYVRLTQLGSIRSDWPVREILFYGPEDPPKPIAWREAGNSLIQAVAAHNLQRIYADSWPSSVIFSARTSRKPRVLLPTNHVGAYGDLRPSALLPLAFDPRPGNGLLIFNRETPVVTSRLRRSGIRFDRIEAGAYTLFRLAGRTAGPPLPIKGSASQLNPKEAETLAAGVLPGKRWGTGLPQRPGMTLSIEMDRARTVEWVTLKNPNFPKDYPRGLRAETSLDGRLWKPAACELAEPLVFTGQVLLLDRGPVLRYRIKPAATARFIRLILTASDPVYWWSVEEIQVHGPAGRGEREDGRWK